MPERTPHPQPPSALPDTLQSACREISVGGAELRYLRAGSGRPVVLLHTLRTQLDMFGGVLERLDLGRAELVAVDLPGHGHSGAPRVDHTAGYFSDAVEQFLTRIDLHDVILVGESIGATIALTLAARRSPRVRAVVAINPYDYGRGGGIRRSSALANALFTAILWPGIGPVVAGGETRSILRAILAGGVCDSRALRPELLEELYRSGSRPGHARALRSLCHEWRSSLERCGHFASLEHPAPIARLITSELK